MSHRRKVFQEATLSSNCPECYASNSLLFTVYQKEIDNRWFYKLSTDLSEDITCKKCETPIYPVRYTDDIERVKAFYLKSMGEPKKVFRIKKTVYLVVILLLLAVTASWFVWQQPELFTVAP